jgi:hypothetical protein
MKNLIVPALFAVAAFGQTTTTPVIFPAIPLPTAVSACGEFNQLGSPRFTMGISAIYPVVASAGIYGTTMADILPSLRQIQPAARSSVRSLLRYARGFIRTWWTQGTPAS